MKIKCTPVISTVSACLLAFAVFGAAPAAAATEKPGLYPEGNSVRIVTPQNVDGGVSPQATFDWADGDVARFGAEGQGAALGSTIHTSFDTKVVSTGADTHVELSGTSGSFFGGSEQPTNITTVDHFWANGVNVSVSFPAGGNAEITEDSLTFTVDHGDVSYAKHGYFGIQFSGLLTAVNQTSSATWTFGPQAFTVIAD